MLAAAPRPRKKGQFRVAISDRPRGCCGQHILRHPPFWAPRLSKGAPMLRVGLVYRPNLCAVGVLHQKVGVEGKVVPGERFLAGPLHAAHCDLCRGVLVLEGLFE